MLDKIIVRYYYGWSHPVFPRKKKQQPSPLPCPKPVQDQKPGQFLRAAPLLVLLPSLMKADLLTAASWTPVLWGVGPVLAGHQGWIGAKAFVILSTLICLWKHSPEGLCWRVDDFSYILALLESEVVLLCVIFSNFILKKSFIFQQADPGHTSPGGTRCMHIFLIVTMHHRPLLENERWKNLTVLDYFRCSIMMPAFSPAPFRFPCLVFLPHWNIS